MMAVPPDLQPVLKAPLQIVGGVNRLGRSVWLYLALVMHASNNGTVIRARLRFAESLGVSEAEIDTWLQRLLAAKLIDLRSASPFLVISLRFWPRSGGGAKVLKDSAAGSIVAAEAAVASKQAILSKQGDEGPGEGDAIFAELTALLGEADAADIRPVIADYPTAIVRQALERVKATPGRQIKKSRTALFRYLLKTISNDLHDHPPAIQLEP